jgi:UDP:flavonoid glycosyltransferase YjiC (YdhE family)
MRAGLVTWGSSGDVRPFIALAAGLKAAGHDVHLVISDPVGVDYAPLCGALGIPFSRVPEKIEFDMAGYTHKFARTRNSVKALKAILDEGYFPFVEQLYAAALDLAADSDVLVGHMAVHPVKMAGLKTGRPQASVTFWPGMVSTALAPPYRWPGISRSFTRLGWRVADLVVDLFFKKKVNEFWTAKGLPPIDHVLGGAWYSDGLNLVAASPALWPEPADWAPRHRMCGYFNLPTEAEEWSMPAELAAFLDDGPAPVYMTFGTAQLVEPEKCVETMVAAARVAKCRAIIQASSPEHPIPQSDGDVYFLGPTPHSEVFPRCAAAVHHGGAGTTHSALRAGLPAVVVGFSDEHMSWGTTLERAGVGSGPLAYRTVTPEKLAKSVRAVLDSDAMRPRAAELAAKMSDENGPARAAEIIEDFAAR